MEFIYSSGGREKYYKVIKVGDCVVRAIANATGENYKDVYDLVNSYAAKERKIKGKTRSSARNGVKGNTVKKILKDMGWGWISARQIGNGSRVHLNESELPRGTLIVSIKEHLTCVKDGKLYDTYDSSRKGTAIIYGYWIKQ